MTARTVPAVRGVPLLGSITDFRRDILDAMTAGFREHGDLVAYKLGPVTVYGVSSPDLAGEALTETARFGKLGADNPLRLVLGTGLLTSSDHESWLRNRRMMQPLYTKSAIAGMYATMVSSTQDWLDHLARAYRPGDLLDMHKETMRVTLDIVSRAMFSTNILDDLDTIGPHAVDIAINFAFQRLQNPFSPPVSWPTPGNRRFKAVMTAIDSLMYRLIAERRAAGPADNDLLDMLLACKDDATGEGMTDRELRDEIITTFAAGHETTAITLTWALYLLSQHPRALRKLQDEVDTLDGRLPTLEDLPNLPYTLRVFEEALRLYPSAPIVPRLTGVATTLGGYELPAGARVLVSLFNIQRNPDHWDDPERFEPDRFDPAARKTWHRFAYLPFGAGPHLCIGKHFALMEAQLLLAALIQRYELRHLPGHRVVQQASITLRPRYGMEMTMHPRRRVHTRKEQRA
ncbi:cytochrome P450 [Catellatospora sp. KI3]|uniref:cytochrome P450 n=1 Tax=Catellatospora sp. KI3 TaxID=3041620 RepID=UPI0024828B51|nr:cytochrome P450 [Catellatospora sp. KI3]MDI1461119.1 cytochrome P450 [Catellatospora sp. KI3]